MIRYPLIAALFLAGLTVGPVAAAVPGDPMQGCEGNMFGAVFCDGPIQPDGTWKRCTSTPAQGGWTWYVPPTLMCRIIALPVPPVPLGQPDHHID